MLDLSVLFSNDSVQNWNENEITADVNYFRFSISKFWLRCFDIITIKISHLCQCKLLVLYTLHTPVFNGIFSSSFYYNRKME